MAWDQEPDLVNTYFQVRLTLLLQSIFEGTLSERVGQQCILTVQMSPAADADPITPA